MDRLAGSVLQYRQDCRHGWPRLSGGRLHQALRGDYRLDGDHAHHRRHHVRLGLYHIFILPATSNATSTEDKNLGEALRELWNVFADFFKKKHIVYYLFFIILYRFCEGFVMKIVPLFLKAPRTGAGSGTE